MKQVWIQQRLREIGKTQVSLAGVLGISPPAVTDIINCHRQIKSSEVTPLAEFLGISQADVLRLSSGRGEDYVASFEVVTAPLLDKVQAGHFASMCPEDMAEAEKIPVIYRKPTVFALLVEGDSMDQIAPPGSIIVVDYSVKILRNRQLGVFARHGGEATFKRYRAEDGDRYLEPVSSNQKHRQLSPTEFTEFQIVGLVVQIIPNWGDEDVQPIY